MVKHEENIFLRGNAEFFLHFQVNSFKTESVKRGQPLIMDMN